MFASLKNIDTAFQQVKTIATLFVILCLLLTGYAIFASLRAVSTAHDKIYVLADGQLLSAGATSVAENRPVEARDHVKRFHEYFFTLDPDQKAIESNINSALYLADGSAKKLYDNFKEQGFFNALISANISQKTTVDSIQLDPKTYYARCFAKQQIIRATTLTTRLLVTECYLRNVTRSDNNPHGFLMEKFRVISNTDLRTEARL